MLPLVDAGLGMPMRYFVPPDLLTRAWPNPAEERVTREAIAQLIERYNLRRKKILSLGAGIAREERWLAELGDTILLLSISTNRAGMSRS
jgi:hypothetical protein